MNAYILDAVRTPIGRHGGALATLRVDDLAALPLAALKARNADADWKRLDEVILGDANQSGETNRNVARMAALLAGLPVEVPGTTVNRLCGSGLDAVGMAARGVKTGEYRMAMAGGVEGMSRAPYVIGKADAAYGRGQAMFDTTIGWRFINPVFAAQFGTESMPQTADNVAAEYGISRDDQDAFAARSQARWAAAQARGDFAHEIIPVSVPQRRGPDMVIEADEHPRPETDRAALARLKGINGPDLSVTAGNASGINDGAAALLLGDRTAAESQQPLARVLATAAAGVPPRVMGIGPVPATRKVLELTGLSLGQMDVIEINEAFAAQSLACLRALGLPDDAAHVNPNGGAIAMGHPLGMSGARLVIAASNELQRRGARYALCTMCVGVGQGMAMVLERV